MFLRLLLAFVVVGGLAAVVTVALRDAGAIPVVVVVTLLAVSPAWFFARRIVRPFRELGAAADRVAQGDYDRRVHGGPWNDFHDLATRFNDMTGTPRP